MINYLLMILFLFTVACGADFQGSAYDIGEAGASVGSAGSSGAGIGGNVMGGAGGSDSAGAPSAGTGNVAMGGGSGTANAGAGGVSVTCDAPEIVLPTEFSLASWSMESAGYCAACIGEPCAVCTISWGEPTWVTDDTFSVTMNSFICQDSMLQAGQCGSEGECLSNLSMPETSHPRLEFTVEPSGSGFRVLPALPEQRDVSISIVTEPGCSNSPANWDGQLLQEIGTKYTAFLNGLTFECSEN